MPLVRLVRQSASDKSSHRIASSNFQPLYPRGCCCCCCTLLYIGIRIQSRHGSVASRSSHCLFVWSAVRCAVPEEAVNWGECKPVAEKDSPCRIIESSQVSNGINSGFWFGKSTAFSRSCIWNGFGSDGLFSLTGFCAHQVVTIVSDSVSEVSLLLCVSSVEWKD